MENIEDIDENYLTVKQVAKILKVSEQTVKRRIRIGEYRAEKRPLPGKENYMWVIPKTQINAAMQTIDAVQTTRQITVSELQEAMGKTIEGIVKEETAALRNQIDFLQEQLKEQKTFIDTRLTQIAEAVQQQQTQQPQPPVETKEVSKPSFWSRLFG